MADNTYFVTGGSGYVGSVVVHRLVGRGARVVVFDNAERGFVGNIPEGCEFIKGDLRDYDLLHRTISEIHPDAVLHFAAYAYVGESVRDPLMYFDSNVRGGINLLLSMRDAGCRRLVFSSSCSAYGIPHGGAPITESADMLPVNPYGMTKLMFEQIAQACSSVGIVIPTFLRYFNAAGAAPSFGLYERHSPEPHIIPRILQVAAGVSPSVCVFGNDYDTRDGTCIRDYVHVCDLCDAHVLALDSGISGAFNLGTGIGYSVLELVAVCKEVTGRDIQVEFLPRRPGDPPILVADAEKARSVLGWAPKRSDIRTIVEDAWGMYKRAGGVK